MLEDADFRPANVLIIDDEPDNLRLIVNFLAEQGLELMLSRSGEQGLEKLRLVRPDLILLDVHMPGMDGFEVCRCLKADPDTADIPVVFMTALHDTEHKVKGLRLGAVDYIIKPIAREELLIRVQTHLKLDGLQKQLAKQNKTLKEQNAELEAYAHTIAHSLKTPLAAAGRFLEILSKFKGHTLSEEQHYLIEQALNTLGTSAKVIDDLLLLSIVSHEHVPLTSLDMKRLVDQALQQLGELKANAQANIQLPQSWPQALGYAPWVGEVWLNYLSNALKYSAKPVQLEVGGAAIDENNVRFWVRDSGPPLEPEQHQRLFVPFNRLHTDQDIGHGLGLSIVRRIIDKLEGEAGALTLSTGGNEFFFTLPAVKKLSPKG